MFRYLSIILAIAVGCAHAPHTPPQTFEQRFEALRHQRGGTDLPRICVLDPNDRVEDITRPAQCPSSWDSITPIDFRQRTTTLLVEVGDADEVGVRYEENGGGNFTSFPILSVMRQWNPDVHVAAAIGRLHRGDGTVYAEAMIRDFVMIEETRFAVLEVRMPGVVLTEEDRLGAFLWVYVPGFLTNTINVQRVPIAYDDPPNESGGGSPRYATAL